ncbi:Protein of unknown function [Thermobacillus xylanilyticus]|jgi:hypothetical protein
MIVV